MNEPTLQHLFHPDHVGHYVRTMTSGVDHLAGHLLRCDGPSRGTQPDEAERRVRQVDLDRPLGHVGEALAEMSEVWLDDAVWFHEPSYAAHLNCPVMIPALLAELYVSGVNASLDTFDQSVGATFIERHLVEWTAGRVGYGPGADGVFTSGGTQSNLQGLLLARDQAAARGVPRSRMRVLTSAEAHFSVRTAAATLGLGDAAVIAVGADARRRMDPDGLERAIRGCVAEGVVPVAVVATAGTTDFGAIDPLTEVADVSARHGAWLHVDAAYGGGLLVSRRHGHLLAGIENADSVTVDYHKTWFLPVSASALLVRDRSTLRHVTWHADYLNPRGGTDPNQVDKSLQTTRRFDALKLWLTLRLAGPDTIGEYVDSVVGLAAQVHDDLRQVPEIEVAAAPELSTLVLRYRPDGLGPDAVGPLNDRIRAALHASGRGMVAATRVDGEQWLKLTLLNPMATPAGVLGLVEEIRRIGVALVAGDEPAVRQVAEEVTQ